MELESRRSELESRGLGLAAMSYDSVAILENFAERKGITFPLLADPDYETIQEFGIVNDGVPKDAEYYGFAYAGYYVVDPSGVVKAKFFNEENNDRTTSASILIREFGADANQQGAVETDHLILRWSTSNIALRPGQRGALVLDVELKEDMHVYAPGVEGYIAIDWNVAPATGVEIMPAVYPGSETKHLPAIEETVPVYEGAFRVLRDVRLLGGRQLPDEIAGKTSLTLAGSFKYQACDATKCYLPATIPLEWSFGLRAHDLERVPESIRRGAE